MKTAHSTLSHTSLLQMSTDMRAKVFRACDFRARHSMPARELVSTQHKSEGTPHLAFGETRRSDCNDPAASQANPPGKLHDHMKIYQRRAGTASNDDKGLRRLQALKLSLKSLEPGEGTLSGWSVGKLVNDFWWRQVLSFWNAMMQADTGSITNIVLHDAIAIAQNGCSYGWAAQVFRCFAEHGKSSPLVAGALGAPVELQPDELQLSFQLQQQAAFDAVPLDPRCCPSPGVKLCTYPRWFSRPSDHICPVYWEVPMSTAKLQRILRFRMGSHLLPIEQGCPICACLAIGVCVGSVALQLWVMKGILFLTALILPMFAASFVHCIKMLMVPCNVLCGTKTRRLSATA